MNKGIWRHKNCLDIDMEILKVQFLGLDYVKYKVIYWRRAYNTNVAFVVDHTPESVKILRSKFKDWSRIR